MSISRSIVPSRVVAAVSAALLLATGIASAASTPYTGTAVAIPSTIQAENYDKGGEGSAYHDTASANVGGKYRTTEGVDIMTSPDTTTGGYIVSHFEAGEWLSYTINAATAGSYDVEIRAASTQTNSAYHIEIDGQNVTGQIIVPSTGSWSTYQWVGKKRITVTAGKHVLKVVSEQPYFGLDAIRFTAVATATATPYSGTPAAMPGTIEAENFDKGGEGLAYHETTATNTQGQYRTAEGVDIMASATGGYIVSHFEAGEWLNYTVNVATAGSYDLEVLASSGQADSAYHVEIDGQNVTGRITVPNTSDWNAYQWVGKTRVSLTAGKHVLKVMSEQPYFGLDAIRIAAPTATTTTTSSARLLFSSGFEGGAITMPTPTDCWGTGCWQEMIGVDSVTNSNWPGNLWGGSGKFLMLTDPVTITPLSLSSYMFNRIETVTGHNGTSTKALYQQITKNANGTAPMGTSPEQNEFQFLPKTDPGDVYMSYWVKLQPDLVTKMNNLPDGPGISGGGTWRAFFAAKTGGQTSWGGPADNGDYRMEVYVMTYGGGQPYWKIIGDNNAGGGAPAVNTWSVENRNVPVPVGQWFKFEIFWHRSSGTDGRVWMAVNGQVIADRRGANMGAYNLPINRIMAPMVYSGSTMPIYQWIDDLEVWNGFPAAGSNPPYAPH